MLDTFLATHERPLRVLLMDAIGAAVAAVFLFLFGSWGLQVPSVL